MVILLSGQGSRSVELAALGLDSIKGIGSGDGNLRLSAYPAARASWPTRSGASRRSARHPPSRAAGRPRPARLQLPLGLGSGRPRRLPRHRSRPLGARGREPGAPAAGGGDRPARGRRGGRRAARPRRRARGARARRPRPPAPRRDHDARAPDRVLLRRVRRPRLAPDLLGRPRRARRRHPQGGLRPRAGRWSPSACCTATATSASASTPAAGSTSTGSTPTRTACPPRSSPATTASRSRSPSRSRDDEVTAQIWRVDVGRIPLFLLDAERPENYADRRAGSRRACTSATRTRAWRSTCCSASAACARWRRWGSSRASCTSTRATRRSCRSSSRARDYSGTARCPRRWRSRRERTIFTTHTPVPAGNDTYPAEQVADTLAQHRRHARASTPRRSSSLGPHASRRGRRAVRRHAVRAAHVARRQRRVAAATARSRARCGRRCGPTAPSTTSRSPTSPTACTSRRGSASRCGELLNRHLGEDWLDRATDPATWAPVDDIPAEELWDVRNDPARAH